MFQRDAPDFGLPPEAFLLLEVLCWVSQSVRSGVWTYYEATPSMRQTVCSEVLHWHAQPELAAYYNRGMNTWEDDKAIRIVDDWIRANEANLNDWLYRFAITNRDVMLKCAA